ncbi:hypothetical protein [Crossiella sp. NPDC003009]
MSFIDAHTFSLDLLLRVLGIPPSTYHDWLSPPVAPSQRELEDAQLLDMIVKIRTTHELATHSNHATKCAQRCTETNGPMRRHQRPRLDDHPRRKSLAAALTSRKMQVSGVQ